MNNDGPGAQDLQGEKINERKRKAAYLESIFKNGAKSPKKDNREPHDRVVSMDSTQKYKNASRSPELGEESNSMVKRSVLESSVPVTKTVCNNHTQNSNGETLSPNERLANNTNQSGGADNPPEDRVIGSPERTPDTRRANESNTTTNSPNTRNIKEMKSGAGQFQSTVVVKKEPNTDPPQVQIVSVKGSTPEERVEQPRGPENEDISDDYIKFLLFAGRLYCCSKICGLSQNMTRFTPENTQGRKGKVVVVLLFHKTFREVASYVVGLVEHTASKDQTLMIKIIKSQGYPTSLSSQKLAPSDYKELKFAIGSKKLLYNLQSLDGPVYDELVKILDGFGANSAVDHAKISEFNAMINANADRVDGHRPNNLALSFPRSSTAPYTTLHFTNMGTRPNKHNVRYSPVGNRSRDSYSPNQVGSTRGNTHERPRSHGSRDVENGVARPSYPLQGKPAKGDQVYTVQANRTTHISPGNYNEHEHPRIATSASSGIPYRHDRGGKVTQDVEISPPRRNVQDLQTVAELCKEKMKRDMAEQELKSIKAAFEEFKSQMQHHLSQVEERMVHLEAENRTLKGKLSNMHQTNGYAEKKYHELRNRLEELLKTV